MADHVVHVQSGEYGPVEDLHLMFDHVVTDWFRTVVMPRAGVEIGADGED